MPRVSAHRPRLAVFSASWHAAAAAAASIQLATMVSLRAVLLYWRRVIMSAARAVLSLDLSW